MKSYTEFGLYTINANFQLQSYNKVLAKKYPEIEKAHIVTRYLVERIVRAAIVH